MARDDELDWILLVRYFAGEATPSERAQLESWAAAHPERAEELAALRQVWTDAGHIPSKARIDSMWTELLRRARSTGASPPVTERHAIGNLEIARGSAAQRPVRVLRFPPERRTAAYWRLTTAALAASTVIAVGMKWLGGKQDAPGVGATATQPALREFATARGQRATIRLLDGTRVELGYASTLRVAPFRAGRRELWLEGEAIFDVIHDERRPFVVHAANAITQDLGTLFSVRAYPDDDDVRVVVVSGLVSLRAKRGTVDSPNASGGTRNVPGTTAAVLYPGQMGLLDTRGKLRVAPVDTAAHMAWLSGRIAIDNAPLSAIAADLERRFDVSIAIPESVLAAQRVTINTPTAVRTLGDVLDLITIPLGVRHRRTERGILLER